MLKFEDIHKNKKWAFIDGLLCGAYIGFAAVYAFQKIRKNEPIVTVEEWLDEQENTNP